MEGRKWEDLEMECLSNIFDRVGMESLVLDVPLVCKSWNKATLDPKCWQTLIFPYDLSESRLIPKNKSRPSSAKDLFKFVLNRSQKCASLVIFPKHCTEGQLFQVANKCPSLKHLGLPFRVVFTHKNIISRLMKKFKDLERLYLGGNGYNLPNILSQISLHCRNFVWLEIENGVLYDEIASSIVASLPKIKYLVLRNCSIQRECLVTIIQCCKELVYLDVSNSRGFEVDDEILKLGSCITTFKYDGSSLEIDMVILQTICPMPGHP
ncbi:hypothetical protein LguiB_013405 [Lonicera macranthoides]